MTRANFYIYENGEKVKEFSAIADNYPSRVLPLIKENVNGGVPALEKALKDYDDLTFNVCWEYKIKLDTREVEYWEPILNWRKWTSKKPKEILTEKC